MAMSSLGTEKKVFHIVQDSKEICFWETAYLADAVKEKITKLPFMVLRDRASAQGICSCILDTYKVDSRDFHLM